MTPTDIFRLDGKRVLITGASSGFGAHFAGVLSAAGATVILGARRVDKLEKTAAAVRAAGGQAEVVRLDVGDALSVEDLFRSIALPDVVINNAGINIEGSAVSLTEDEWDQVMDTNVKGVWLVAREAIKRWVEAGRGGNIINIASILGLRVQNQLPVYTASKAAVIQLTRSLALDYARHGIRVNAICPGYFETDINRDWFRTEGGQKMIKRVPMRRLGELHELNGPLLLLASEASSYMSGASIVVDGAHTQNTL
ncbi:MAG: SDR family NAD(P)-dependent oxidoreductase [Gammaproteobacteria bacterium]